MLMLSNGGGLVDICIPTNVIPKHPENNGSWDWIIKNVSVVTKAGSVPKDRYDGKEYFFFDEKNPLTRRDIVSQCTIRHPNDQKYYYVLYLITDAGRYSNGYVVEEKKMFGVASAGEDRLYISWINDARSFDPIGKWESGKIGNDIDGKYIYYCGLTSNRLDKKISELWNTHYLKFQKHFLQNVIKNYPAAVNDDGTVRYWLNPKDYTKKIDGTESDWNNPDFDGNFCAWIGSFNIVQNVYLVSVHLGMYPRTKTSTQENGIVDFGFENWDHEICKGFWLPMIYYVENFKGSTKRHMTSDIDLYYNEDDIMNGPTSDFQYYKATGQEDIGNGLPNQNKHRVPMMASHFEVINIILMMCSLNFRTDSTFGFGGDQTLTGAWTTSQVIPKNAIVNDDPTPNGRSVLPGFYYGSDGTDDTYVKMLHSIIFFSNRLCLLDIGFERLKETDLGYRLWVGIRRMNDKNLPPNRNAIYSRISGFNGGPTSTSQTVYKNYFQESPTALFVESVGEVPNQGQPSDVTFSSLTGNCGKQFTRYMNDDQPVVRYICGGAPDRNSLNHIYIAQNWTARPCADSVMKKYIPTLLFPDPDYDPFEATNYRPWLEEE